MILLWKSTENQADKDSQCLRINACVTDTTGNITNEHYTMR